MRLVRLIPLLAPLLFATLGHAESLTVDATLTRSLKGGVAVDGWGDTSTESNFATGSLQIQLPAGAVVEEAVLVSSTISTGIVVPPATLPRVVIVGTGAAAVTRTLEGTPDFSVAASNAFGTWRTDVKAAVVDAIGPSATGVLVNIAVSERGDGPGANNFLQILGHELIVVYSHPLAPRRNVVVALGAGGATFQNGSFTSSLTFPSPVLGANVCNVEATPLSFGLPFEYSGLEEIGAVTLGTTVLSSTAGGADEWAGVHATGPLSGLFTAGSFGATSSPMVGSPVGVDNDVLGGVNAGRLDDELYDARNALADGATTTTFGFASNSFEYGIAAVLQTLARVSPTDADGDGLLDAAEAACPVDSDSDGTPNLLDPDSDNDCLGDGADPAPTLPSGPSLTNCPSNASPICAGTGVTPACGACSTTAQCTQRSATTPICQSGACVAAPTITAPSNGQIFVSGVSAVGTGPVSSTLEIFGKEAGAASFTLITTVSVNAGGDWSVGPAPLPAGTYTIFARSTLGGANTDSNQVTFTIVDPVTPDLLPPADDLAVPLDLTDVPPPDLTAPEVDLTTPIDVDLLPPVEADLLPPVAADLLPLEGADLGAVATADLLPVEGADLLPPAGADLATASVDMAGMAPADLRHVLDFTELDLTPPPPPDLRFDPGSRAIAGGGFGSGCSANGSPESVSGLALLILLALGSARALRSTARRRRR